MAGSFVSAANVVIAPTPISFSAICLVGGSDDCGLLPTGRGTRLRADDVKAMVWEMP
jgi:hypothetical protein